MSPTALLLALALTLPIASATEETPTGATPPDVPAPTPASAPEAAPPRAPPVPPTPKAPAPAEVSGGPGKGITVRAGDSFSLNLRARIQLRYQLKMPPPGEDGERALDQTFAVGTARVWVSGHVLSPKLTYMIQLAVAGRDYREGATSPVFDAYLDYALHRDVKIRAGQFFVPFDRLRTVREFALQMVDRPRPVAELTLDRDVGVVLSSDHFLGDRSPVAWRLGVFGGGGTNLSVGKPAGALIVGRLELRPLGDLDDDSEGDLERRKKPGLALGGGFAANLNTNRLKSTTGTTFLGGTTTYLHAAGDLTLKWRGFALQGEYLWKKATEDTIATVDADGAPTTSFTRSGQGWVVQASYLFPKPVEVVGRFTQIYAIGDTDPKLVADLEARGNEVGAGLNVYLNGHRMKLQAGWTALLPRDFDFDRAEHSVVAQVDATF